MPTTRRKLAALGLLPAALVVPGLAPAGAAALTDAVDPVVHSADDARLSVLPVSSYDTFVFDESAAEIVEHYAAADRLLVVNAAAPSIDVLDAADPTDLTKLFEVEIVGVESADGSVVPDGAAVNSVVVRPDGLGLAAVEAPTKTDLGWIVAFDASGEGSALGAVRVGALPDMVTITPDGARAVVANEGEPAEDYLVDPEGSISVIDLPAGVAELAQGDVATADFHAFEGDALPEGVRTFGGREDAGTGTPDFPVSENLEPEYVTVERRSKRAYVTLQEANAVAVVNLRKAKITKIWPLGTVDHSTMALDATDEDEVASLRTWPVQGFRMPDAMASFRKGGQTYLVTADEGDSRDWEAYSEEARVGDLGDDGLVPVCTSVAEQVGMTVEELQDDDNLGRLTITTAQGLSPDGSCYETLYSFGGRGFSIFTTSGELVASSGSELEEITAEAIPDFFNSDHGSSSIDNRSDNKGPEPEGVTVGKIGKRTYAFVGLERVGGVMVYDVTEPTAPAFVTYVNNRDFAHSGEDLDPEDLPLAGDLGPEGVELIPAASSPTGRTALVVGNEVSGTTTWFDITKIRRQQG